MRIAVASVNTGNERRDNHLRTADFFAADEHPQHERAGRAGCVGQRGRLYRRAA